MNHSMPGLPVHHQLLESTQTHVHWVSDAIQPSHPLSSPFPPALNLSQHQGLFKCQLFASDGPSTGVSASASVLPMNIQDWFPLGWTARISLQSKGSSVLGIYGCLGWRRQWHPTPVLLPGKSHGRRSLVGCSPWGREESDTTELLPFHLSLSCIGEGNGNPLQYSCLENPRDGETWWAAVYGVTQSWTRLKRLSSSNTTC